MATKTKAKKTPKKVTPVFTRVQYYQCKCSEIIPTSSPVDWEYYECTVCSSLPTEDDMYEEEEEY